MADEFCAVTDTDLGFTATRYAVKRLSRFKVTIGVHGKDRERKKGEALTNPELAAVHEFGADFMIGPRHIVIPARSFLRATVDENASPIDAKLLRVLDDVAALKETPKEALEGVALWLQGLIQQRIANGIGPALKPATIKRKGDDKPLIDSGQLRQSITFVVDEKAGAADAMAGATDA